MKKLHILSIALLSLVLLSGLNSCNKLKDLAKVNINLDNSDGQFTIPIVTTPGTENVMVSDVYINLDSIIKAENEKVGVGNIKEVKLTSCKLNLTNSDASNNFSALQSCYIQVKSNSKSEFTKMASVDNNPDVEASTLDLPVNAGLDLKDYFLNANTFTFSLGITSRKATTKELKGNVVVKYTLVAGL